MTLSPALQLRAAQKLLRNQGVHTRVLVWGKSCSFAEPLFFVEEPKFGKEGRGQGRTSANLANTHHVATEGQK